MSNGLDILRSTWQRRDYEDIRNDYINDSLEHLDIEELTLLECASYQYQTERESIRRQQESFLLREEAFRSNLRHQRRLKIDALIRDIREDKRSIYDISSENKKPYFLMECFFRLTGQYNDMHSIPDTFPIEPDLLEEIFAALNNVLKNPSQQTQDTAWNMIDSLDNEEIRSTLKDALSYLIEPSLKVERQANEFLIKNLLYEEDQHDEQGKLVKEGRGYIGDLIISIYEGRQKSKIVKTSNINWDDVVKNVKKACFSYAGRENEINDYALSVHVNDYPGTKESKVERPFWGESIGLGSAIAILAYLKECSVKQGVAFTGNINANYSIGEVGGFRGNGKAYAACWSEIKRIIVPKENVENAKKQVKKAIRDRARCNTEVIGVADLSEVEEEIFQSFLSPKLDEIAINEFPFPIAFRYKHIPIGEDMDKKELIFQTLIAAMQYLSLIVISQYTIRDADRGEVQDRGLATWFCDELGKKSETWGIAFFKFLRHYLTIGERNKVELFASELYDISDSQYDLIEARVIPAMDLHHNVTQGNTKKGTTQAQIDVYTRALEMVLEKFSFIKDYHLIRISKEENQNYIYSKYTGTEPDTEEYKLPHKPDQELILGQLYLAKPDYSDFLHIHPMLVFWSAPTDVLLYHHLGEEKVNYLPSFQPGFLATPDHFFEIRDIYERLRRGKEKKPSFDELDWVHIRERAREDSSIGDFDSKTYTKRNDVMGVLHQYLSSDKNCLVISGNAGSGKTSFLCNLADELRNDEDFCVLVYPAENLGKQSIEEKLSDILVEDYEGAKDEFLKRLNETKKMDGKKLIVCIDAINEHDTPKQLLASLDRTVEKRRYPWFKVIITCRTNVWKRIGPPTVRLTENRYYRHGDNSDMAIYLQDFGTEELPEAYEKYKSRYNLQTIYDDLPGVVERMIKDPLMLWLVAESHSNEEIPALGFSINSIYQKYVTKLEEKGRLEPVRDRHFLMEQLVPLMAENGNYTNKISVEKTYEHLVSVDDPGVNIPLSDLMYSHDEKRLKTPYIRLLDTGILKEEGKSLQKTIEFRIERFYEFSLGSHIQKKEIAALPDTQAKLARFHDIIEMAREVPYFWGVVRQSLIMDRYREDILKELAQTDDRITRNMVVDCLISLAKDESKIDSVCDVLSYLIGLRGKSKTVRNSKKVAIQVASELCRIPELVAPDSSQAKSLSGVLEKAVYDKNRQIRNTAYEYVYYLSIDNPSTALKIVGSLSRNVKITWRVLRLMKSVVASAAISLLIYSDAFSDSIEGQTVAQQTITALQTTWADIIRRHRRLLIMMLWASKTFSKLMLKGGTSYNDPFNYYELSCFFRDFSQAEKDVLVELTPYLRLERRDICSAADTIVGLTGRSDMLSFYQIIYILTAQASTDKIDDAIGVIERIYQDGSNFSKSFCSWALDSIMWINNSRIDIYRRLIERRLDDIDNWWTKSRVTDTKYCSYALSELINHHERAHSNITPQILDKYMDMAKGDAELLLCIIENMGALAVYFGCPSIAIDVLRQIIDDDAFAPETLLFRTKAAYRSGLNQNNIPEGLLRSFRDNRFALSQGAIVSSAPAGYLITDRVNKQIYYVEKAKGKLDVYSQAKKRFIETLVGIRSRHPEAVEDLLQSIGDGLSDKDKRTVRTSESSEDLGHLFGMNLTSMFPQLVAKSPGLRNEFADAIAVASKCRNIGVWIDQVLRRIANCVAGEEVLKVIPLDEE